MLTPINAVVRLTAADLQARKRRWTSAAVLYAVAGTGLLFAIGFAAAAFAVWLAATYDPIIALTVTACLFLTVAALALIVNALLQRRARRRNARNSAVRGAALATALVALRRSNKTLLPIAAGIAGLALAARVALTEDEDADE